jgi:hypothetical protein
LQCEPPIDLHLAGKALTLEEAKAYLARTNWNADAARALVKAEGRTFFESHGTSRLLRRLLTHQRLSVGLSLRRRINHRHVVPVVTFRSPCENSCRLKRSKFLTRDPCGSPIGRKTRALIKWHGSCGPERGFAASYFARARWKRAVYGKRKE